MNDNNYMPAGTLLFSEYAFSIQFFSELFSSIFTVTNKFT